MKGYSLLELLVVMVSVVLVGSIGFNLLDMTRLYSQRDLSIASRQDRLRILQAQLDCDLTGRIPLAPEGSLFLGDSQTQDATRTFLKTQVYHPDSNNQEVDRKWLTYQLEKEVSGKGRYALVRRLEMPGATGMEALHYPMFYLDPAEDLIWETTSAVSVNGMETLKLGITLVDKRFKDRPVHGEMLLVDPQR